MGVKRKITRASKQDVTIYEAFETYIDESIQRIVILKPLFQILTKHIHISPSHFKSAVTQEFL